MTPTPLTPAEQADQPAQTDPALLAAVDFARAAAQEQAGDEPVGGHVAVRAEDEVAATHYFEADRPGYGGWRWAVTVACAGPGTPVTASEVVLLPGPDALVAPQWVPWQERVQAGDLGVGDLLPTAPDDPRLAPGYAGSDDEALEDSALEAGLGRVRVMSRFGRVDAADRWQGGDFGPGADMARGAPAHCGTCGFYLPVAGSLGAAFGVCGNEIAPADGHVVHAEYGCGAHSEAEVEQVSPVLVADLIYDDAVLDVEPTVRAERPAQEPAEEQAAAELADVAEVPPVDEAAPAEAPAELVAEPADAPAAEPVESGDGEDAPVAAEPAIGSGEPADTRIHLVTASPEALSEVPAELADNPAAGSGEAGSAQVEAGDGEVTTVLAETGSGDEPAAAAAEEPPGAGPSPAG